MIERFYKTYDLTRYIEFIEECRQKDYSGCGTHKHHIIPKFMGGDDKPENLIILSYADHYDTHMKLAECFTKSCIEYYKNCYSALRLSNWVELGDDLRKRISENQMGEKNHMYGKEFTAEHKSKLSRPGPLNHMYGKTHTADSIEKIKKARSLQIITEETKQKMSKSRKEFLETDKGKQQIAAAIKRIIGRGGKTQHLSEETKQKISKANTGKKHPPRSAESNRKQVESRRSNNAVWHSEETKRRIGESKKGSLSPNRKKCIIENIMYESITDATRTLKLDGTTVRKRLRSTDIVWKDWYYYNDMEGKTI